MSNLLAMSRRVGLSIEDANKAVKRIVESLEVRSNL